MGGGKSKAIHFEGANDEITEAQERINKSMTFPMQVMVAHYTPPNFPLFPTISKIATDKCKESWKFILDTEVKNEDTGGMTSGLTVFYHEFYDRLDLMDSSGRFEAVLSKHASGTNKMAAKGAILLRIIKYVLNFTEDNSTAQLQLFMLGKSHSQKGIRPWQYSTFIIVLLQTISARLGTNATNDVMEAWVNLFAFVMRSMLPPAIRGQVVETEIAVNTSSDFSNATIAAEVEGVEEMKEFKKKMKSGQSSAINSAR